jgi:hypothetical protein
MYKMMLAASAALFVLSAGPAAADKTDFPVCDGYPAPSKKADGMTQGTWLYGLASRTEDVRRNQYSFGAEEAARCDKALADPLLQPQFWLRRGHLLQAKAMHQIEAGDAEGALVTLAASDAVGAAHADLFFADSVGLGNRALRAFALFKLGRRDLALAELDAVDQARPYAADLRSLTRAIRLANTPDVGAQRALLMAAVPTDPSRLVQLFWIGMVFSDFQQVAAIAPQVSFDLPRGRGDWQIEGMEARRYELIETRAEFSGATAYALAATGQGEAARKMMAQARADVAEVMVPPPPPPPGKALKPKVVAEYQARRSAGVGAGKALDRWDAALELRETAPGMTMDAFNAAVRRKGLRNSPAFFDLVGRVQPKTEADKAAHRRLTSTLESQRASELRELWTISFRDLVKMLPRPEREKMKPRYKPAGDGFWLSDATGFYVKREPDSPYINVRFGSDVASRAMVEELGMLAAAMQAKKLGKDSFLIDSRMIIQRTVQVYSYYGGLQSSYPSGNETRLRILPVNAAELPAGLEHSRWRLIKVADVIAALSPRYSPPAPPGRRPKK